MICLAHLRTLLDMNINYMSFDNKKLVQSSVLFWIELGWPIETSIFEDPQSQPQSLRFFEVEDRHLKYLEDF